MSEDKTLDPLFHAYDRVFNQLHPPQFSLKTPSWISKISTFHVFIFILVSYFFFTGGVIYDLIIEPPGVGAVRDQFGRLRPQAIMPYRINGQYMIEGFLASFLFVVGAVGLVAAMYAVNNVKKGKKVWLSLGLGAFGVSFLVSLFLLQIKVPNYLR